MKSLKHALAMTTTPVKAISLIASEQVSKEIQSPKMEKIDTGSYYHECWTSSRLRSCSTILAG
jgi:hypothetical protein